MSAMAWLFVPVGGTVYPQWEFWLPPVTTNIATGLSSLSPGQNTPSVLHQASQRALRQHVASLWLPAYLQGLQGKEHSTNKLLLHPEFKAQVWHPMGTALGE